MRMSKMTVFGWSTPATCPPFRVGRGFRVPGDAVHDYLQNSPSETA